MPSVEISSRVTTPRSETTLDGSIAAAAVGMFFGLLQYRRSAGGVYAGSPLLFEYAGRGRERKAHLLKGLAGWETGDSYAQSLGSSLGVAVVGEPLLLRCGHDFRGNPTKHPGVSV